MHNDELDKILLIFSRETAQGTVDKLRRRPQAITEAKAAINQLLLKARKDELNRLTGFSEARGIYTMGKNVFDKARPVAERIAELDKEIAPQEEGL